MFSSAEAAEGEATAGTTASLRPDANVSDYGGGEAQGLGLDQGPGKGAGERAELGLGEPETMTSDLEPFASDVEVVTLEKSWIQLCQAVGCLEQLSNQLSNQEMLKENSQRKLSPQVERRWLRDRTSQCQASKRVWNPKKTHAQQRGVRALETTKHI